MKKVTISETSSTRLHFHFICVLSDTRGNTLKIYTTTAADRSGCVMSRVLVTKPTLLSVDMQDGEITTVITPRMSQYRVLLRTLNMLVINFVVFDVPVFYVQLYFPLQDCRYLH